MWSVVIVTAPERNVKIVEVVQVVKIVEGVKAISRKHEKGTEIVKVCQTSEILEI